MKQKIKELEINGQIYVLKSSVVTEKKAMYEDYPVYMVRTYSAGVFYGGLKKREGKEVTLVNARRVWRWYGASTLSQLAMEGTKEPERCEFPCPVDEVLLLESIELIPITEKALISLNSVKIWEK